MAPILLNAATTLAGNLIDGISDQLAPSTAKKTDAAAGNVTFASALAQAQATPAVATPTPADQQAALTSSLMSSPEVKTALATVNPSQSVQLEISAAGGVSLRNANGSVHALNVSDNTRAMATQLYGIRHTGGLGGTNAAPMVLAVDPMNASAPVWSTLPARI